MRLLHGKPFDEAELLHFKQKIQISCLIHFADIISIMLKNDLIHPAHRQKCLNMTREYKIDNTDGMDDLIGTCKDRIMSIWNIPSIKNYILNMTTLQNVFKGNEVRSIEPIKCEISILHSDNPAIHFLRTFNRIMSYEYHPTLEDILTLRTPTTGKIMVSIEGVIIEWLYTLN